MKFLDEAKVWIKSGNGGRGCLSFRRERFIEFGGPDGGNGGRGGDIIATCVDGLNTLVDFRYRPHIKAQNGRPGEGRDRTGATGKHAVLKVPAGTQVYTDEDNTLVADLTTVGQSVVLAVGGDGGYGNAHYKTSTNRAPRRADIGWPGPEQWLRLKLKLIADIGLVGLPNAGKSTLLSRVSRARPKIADYPFTTLHPNLGVVGIDGAELVLADLPGLIEGAHQGSGLGDRFLGHVERCAGLIHLIDATTDDPVADMATVCAELTAYGADLADKPTIIALSKCDALSAADLEAVKQRFAALDLGDTHAVSSVAGFGITDLLRAAQRLTGRTAPEADTESAAWQP